MPTVEVFVFAVPGRASHAKLHASLRASDVGDHYTMVYHPNGIPAKYHWRDVHERAASSSADFAIILEDDCIVNRHLLHNAMTWPAIFEDRFGAGWLYNVAGTARGDTKWFGSSMTPGTLWGTVAMLYRTADLPTIIEHAWRGMGVRPRMAWDHAIDYAVLTGLNREVAIHYPSLAEHMLDTPSIVGNSNESAVARKARSSAATFDPTWKRELTSAVR